MKKLNAVIFVIILVGCNIKKVDTTAMKEQMNNHKIKQISKAELIDYVSILGNSAVSNFEKNTLIKENCVYDSLSKEMTQFDLIDMHQKNIGNKNNKVIEIIEAYKYASTNKKAIGTNIQNLNDTSYLFSFQINPNSQYYKECNRNLGLIYFSKKQVINSLTKSKKK